VIPAAPLWLYGAVGGLILAAGAGWWIYERGAAAGSAAITSAMQSKSIETMDAARIQKERADEEIRRTPYGDRADGLR